MTETRSTQTQMFVSRLSGASACGMGYSSPRGRDTRAPQSARRSIQILIHEVKKNSLLCRSLVAHTHNQNYVHNILSQTLTILNHARTGLKAASATYLSTLYPNT